jgi:putative transposase
MEVVKDLVEAKNDLTLEELRIELHQRFEVTVSDSTMCRVMQRLNLTCKKKPFIPARKQAIKYRLYAMSTGMRSEMSE